MSNDDNETKSNIPTIQKVIAILWPSFLTAGVETIVFFTLFDPQDVFLEYDVSRLGAYSIGFFLFWGFAIMPCMLTMYFAKPCKPCAVYKDEIKTDDG
jgi:hypothetical protein